MLEIRQYTTNELCEALNITKGTLKVEKKKVLSKYTYKEIKDGRCKSYNITGYKEAQKSSFVQAIETIAGEEVKFGKEENAQRVLHYLLMKDRTLESNKYIAASLKLDEDTVSRYINKFREYGVLPTRHKVIPATYNADGNKISDKIDRNQYVYSILNSWNNKRSVISRDDWRKYWTEFYRDVENVYEYKISMEAERRERKGLAPMKSGINKYYMDEAMDQVRMRYHRDRGLVAKHVSKQLTDKAVTILSEYYQQLAS
jgi:hypothetical protein